MELLDCLKSTASRPSNTIEWYLRIALTKFSWCLFLKFRSTTYQLCIKNGLVPVKRATSHHPYQWWFGELKWGSYASLGHGDFNARHNLLENHIWDPIHSLKWRHNGHDGVSNHQPHQCLLNRLFRCRSKKTSKLRVTGLCAGNSPKIGEFPAQMASNAENVSI